MKLNTRPGRGDKKNNVGYSDIVFKPYIGIGQLSNVDGSCTSCIVPLSNCYPVSDPDQLLGMSCCVECGGK